MQVDKTDTSVKLSLPKISIYTHMHGSIINRVIIHRSCLDLHTLKMYRNRIRNWYNWWYFGGSGGSAVLCHPDISDSDYTGAL